MTAFMTWAGLKATGTSTGRTLPNRLAEVYNVRDYGALGDNSNDDSIPINAAVTAMFASGRGGTVYLPPGVYRCQSKISIGGAFTPAMGSFIGAGRTATYIVGSIGSGFLVEVPYQVNSVGRISDMSIVNESQVIGTGALRWAQNNCAGLLESLTLNGMTSLDAGWNIFNTTIISVNTGGVGIVCPYGSVGIINGGANLMGWRGGSSTHEIGLTMVGSQSMLVSGNGIEETPVGIVLGLYIGFATATITGANGSKVLTVSGTLYPPAASTATPIQAADQIVTSGVNPTVNPSIIVVSQLTGTTNEQGTYSLSGADGVTISTAQPIQIRRRFGVGNFSLNGFETEGVGIGVYVLNAGGGEISGMNITGQINQGSTNQYGGAAASSDNVSSTQCSIYIEQASALTISNSSLQANCTQAGVQFSPNVALLKKVTLFNCISHGGTGGVSDSAAFIDNGAGTTLVTNATTSSSSAVLNFAASSIPGSVVAGVPVYGVTTPAGIPIYSRVSSVNNGAGTVTLNQNTNGVASGATIKFCVPSGVAGNVLTVQTITCTLGRNTTVFPAGLYGSGTSQGGFSVQGSGVPTGTDTPRISDQVNGYGPGGGGLSYAQYTLIKYDGSAVSLNLSARVFTFVGGKKWGTSNLTGLSGINGNTKAGVQFINCDTDSSIDMVYADLPGESGVQIEEGAQKGQKYSITDCTTPLVGNIAAGSGSYTVDVQYNGTNWIVVGGYGIINSTTFTSLPASPVAGMRSFITDCNTATFHATAAAGGSNKVPVVYDGTNWLVG